MPSDWSKISTDDLTTISEAFGSRFENEDGSAIIYLNSVHWSRCFAILYEINDEMQERDERRLRRGDG